MPVIIPINGLSLMLKWKVLDIKMEGPMMLNQLMGRSNFVYEAGNDRV